MVALNSFHSNKAPMETESYYSKQFDSFIGISSVLPQNQDPFVCR